MENLFIINAKETIDGALFIGYGDSYYSNYMIVNITDIKLDTNASEKDNGNALKKYVLDNDDSGEFDDIDDDEISECQINLLTTDLEIDELMIEF